MILIRVWNDKLEERLIRIDDLSLENTLKLGQAAKATTQQAQELFKSQTGNQTVDAQKLNSSYNTRRSRAQRQAIPSTTPEPSC